MPSGRQPRQLARSYASADLLAEAQGNSEANPQSLASKASMDPNSDVAMADVAKSLPSKTSARGKQQTLPARTNPAQASHVADPGAPDMKRPKRSPAEVAAAVKRREEARVRLEMIEKEKIMIMANMEIDGELDEKAEEDAIVKDVNDTKSDDISEFVDTEPDTARSMTDSDDAKVPVKKSSRKKKPAKGEIRAAVDAAKKDIKAGKKRPSSESLEASAPKRAKPAFPSGLTANWKAKSTSSSGKKGRATSPEDPLDPVIGGLDDVDAAAVQPDFNHTKLGGHKNDSVEIISDSKEGCERIVAKPRPKPIPRIKQVPGPVSKVKKPEVKQELKAIGKAASSVLGLAKPWELSDPTETDDVKTIQMLVDKVFPGSNYKVKLNDKIYAMAKDRINEKRTFFGRQAIKVITAFFEGDRFKNNRAAIMEFAAWATRGDGPAQYGMPTLVDCLFPPESRNYIKPEGPFQSEFIIAVLTPYLKACQGLCVDFGHPVGALGMASAAVECAFLLFTTSTRADTGSLGNFSREKVGHLVDDYISNILQFSDRRWRAIMESCGIKIQQEQAPPLNAPLSQAKQRNLYVPSSPLTGNLDEE
ncbi:hypothetical protein BJV74DRAFT_796436 [Russula compacta]|nr:hypothetical protein BJV74DRAFT_796436 [Russula compacta]